MNSNVNELIKLFGLINLNGYFPDFSLKGINSKVLG